MQIILIRVKVVQFFQSQRLSLVLVSTSLLPTFFVNANNTNSLQAIEDHHTETIVVTGTRTPKLLSNSPVSVTVIDADQIALQTQSTVAQALNFIPGVVVTENPKDGYTVQMQGFDGDNVLVLLNDRPLIAPTGAAVDLDQISAHDIEQIEVIKGAASVMYGSSAMGGVINIRTKKELDEHVTLNYEIGSYTNNSLSDDQFSHQSRINTMFNLGADIQNRFHLLVKRTPGFDYDNDHRKMQKGTVEKIFANYKADIELGDLKAGGAIQLLTENKEKNAGFKQQVPLIYLSEVTQQQLDLDIGSAVFDKQKHELANTSWHLAARAIAHDEYSGQTGSRRDAEIRLYEVNGQYVWAEDDIELVSGGLIKKDSLYQEKQDGSVEVSYETKHSFEAFTQANVIKKDFQILAGVRGQQDSDFGFHSAFRFSGMRNGQLANGKWQWRFGIGQGYRVPTLKERHFYFDHSALGYIVEGNEALLPEESVGVNSSVKLQTTINSTWLGEFDFTGDVNVHYTLAENFIESEADSEKSTADLAVSVYQNIDKSSLSGVDLSAEFQFTHFYSQLNYSYLEARDENTNQRLSQRPRHQIKANIGTYLSFLDLDTVLNLVYQSDEALPSSYQGITHNDWMTFDLKVSQQLFEQFSWRLAIDNIFDEHLDEKYEALGIVDTRPASSRFVSLGITYKF